MEYSEIIQKLKQERIAQKKSLRNLAQRLGVSAALLSSIERGITPLKMSQFLSICECLGVSPSDFLEDKPQESALALAKKMEQLPPRDYLMLGNLIMLMSASTDEL